ncbi:unnamed protein product [Brassica oleracea]|uniref:(rape) hypothetical protein n=1 Tax=Brassica napus TaxID=3708 RepID=A0A816UQS5_BRANA|nr:unnamed protein product [Brassica napus]
MEILKRFPVKTLARLTCVSKLWASTIRRQEFNKLWSSSNQQRRSSSSSTLIFAFKQSLHICIDGVLYYGACFGTGTTTTVVGKGRGVMSFDVRSEKFDVITVPQGRARKFTSMTRYDGKLALINAVFWRMLLNVNGPLRFSICRDWAFVLAPKELQESAFFVLYYDPKKKRVRKVDVEGITEHEELPLWDKDWKRRTVSIFPGQVENLMFL